MKKLMIVCLCIILGFSLSAKNVSFEEAQIIAANWTQHLQDNFNDHVILLSGETITREGIEVAHVFHFLPMGYVVVSTQDYLPPIKMYSLKNNFGNEGGELEELIFAQNREIIQKVNASVIDPEKVFAAKNKGDFQRLKGFAVPFRIDDSTHPVTETATEEVKPLLTTTWWQREPYNLLCPVIDGERCPTGCVATAFAQIMKYHEYPPAGRGSKTYTTYTHKVELSTSFDHPYRWDLMLDDYPTPETGTEEQRQAVAELMFDVGVALGMNYKPGGSGSSGIYAVWDFPKHFDYSQNMIFLNRTGWTDKEWFELAKDQVDLGFPVSFAIVSEEVGHQVVIDGYRISNGAHTIHINLGWGGTWDGYYSYDNIIVRDGKYEFTVLEHQDYVLNMVPPHLEADLPDLPFGAVAHENRSVLQKEYVCEIKWKGLPKESTDKVYKYFLFNYDLNTRNLLEWLEFDHTGQLEYTHTFRTPEYKPAFYILRTLSESGKWNTLMSCHLTLKD